MSRTVTISQALALLLAGWPVGSGTARAASPGAEPRTLDVLVVDGFSNHNWSRTTQLVKQLLEDSGGFSVDVSTSPPSQQASGWDTWRPAFTNYDVVVQNCNSHGGRPSWPRDVELALEQFVGAGGGLYILHSANNAFPEWKEYNRMIGLGWRDRDFGSAITIGPDEKVVRIPPGQGSGTSHGKRIDAVLTRLGEHPIHANLPRQWKAADLEVYSYARGPAQDLTVLSYAREPATGLNFPIEWVVHYGKGRVYNSTFGHVWKNDVSPPAVRCAAFQTLLVRAVEWLGGMDVTRPAPDDFPDTRTTQLRTP